MYYCIGSDASISSHRLSRKTSHLTTLIETLLDSLFRANGDIESVPLLTQSSSMLMHLTNFYGRVHLRVMDLSQQLEEYIIDNGTIILIVRVAHSIFVALVSKFPLEYLLLTIIVLSLRSPGVVKRAPQGSEREEQRKKAAFEQQAIPFAEANSSSILLLGHRNDQASGREEWMIDQQS